MSTIVKADAGGAVTLPAELCLAAGVEPGGELVADAADGCIVLRLAPASLAEQILELARQAPQEVWDRLPTDGASQHDHYIYGTPKRQDLQ
jgi:antitoxin component of MazEF toxin-antitoxin module